MTLNRAVRRILIGSVAVIAAGAVIAMSMPFIIGMVDEQIAAAHGHPFQPATPLPVFLGTGGHGCTVDRRSEVFATGDRIRLVADEPAGAEEVRIDVFSERLENVPGYPAVRRFASTDQCVFEDLPRLPIGQYEASITFGGAGSRHGLISFEVVATG